ncbi:hypothetical protein IV38_GL001950 [Lactobacillus selangorensis]|uniref:Uncharacterized protein n=1 Tax=Lactobacillus selangorensis TaxID=81857 RepID=A0A0R2FGP5_9LACO|nr:hypothetical protein [Lactobacillus selangorensis]KRN27736.1 hypothetical protein IV38_GL001950 [Lactobacillus selangorensis]KRN30299.1 hypothetical protein IV40_GL001887 [Lactobacillus selangorensis]
MTKYRKAALIEAGMIKYGVGYSKRDTAFYVFNLFIILGLCITFKAIAMVLCGIDLVGLEIKYGGAGR